ncbi:hypothetical protein PQ659_29265, partial [Escherichia coli]
WAHDKPDCESALHLAHEEARTDSAARLPCIEQAREEVHTLRQLQFLHQNR